MRPPPRKIWVEELIKPIKDKRRATDYTDNIDTLTEEGIYYDGCQLKNAPFNSMHDITIVYNFYNSVIIQIMIAHTGWIQTRAKGGAKWTEWVRNK